MTSPQEQGCVFCKVVRKELKRRIVYEDKDTIGILDTSPGVGRVQCLVFPKKHVDRFYDLDDENVARLFQGVKKVAMKLKKAFQPKLVVTLTQRQQIRHAYVMVSTNSGSPRVASGVVMASFPRSELDEIADKVRRA